MSISKFSTLLFGFLLCGFIFWACSKSNSPSYEARELNLEDPLILSSPMAGLGKVLFYDKALSANNSISCASCHDQKAAFADPKQFSIGFQGELANRNTPPIQNLIMSFGMPGPSNGLALFWDGRERDLQAMVLQPIVNHVEMGILSTDQLLHRIKTRPYYAQLFEEAFGSSTITEQRVAHALSGFLGNLQSFNSEFDQRGFSMAMNQGYTPLEFEGGKLFFGKYDCGSCHNLHMPNGYNISTPNEEFISIGLDARGDDPGFGAVSGLEADFGKFKIPNLRNVEVTGPYMHDGRFQTLEEVIEHYSTGVKPATNLDRRLKDSSGQPVRLHITQSEKEALVAFLKTLTDRQFLANPIWSDPFLYH